MAESKEPAATHTKGTFRFLPLTLHLETLGGIATPLVLRGTPLPATRTETFSTADDDQQTVEIKVLMGESPLATHNSVIGVIRLEGIPPGSRGSPKIQVSFHVDRACRVTASASLDQSDVRVVSEPIDPKAHLLPESINAALKNAELRKDEDQRAVQRIEAVNKAEMSLSKAEVALAKFTTGGGQSFHQKDLTAKVAAVGIAIQGQDLQRIRQATQELDAAVAAQVANPLKGTGFEDLFGSMFSPPPKTAAKRYASPPTNAPKPSSNQKPATAIRAQPLGQVFGGGNFSLDPSLCFVLMPFGQEFRAFYDDHIKKVVGKAGLSCQRADEISSTRPITWDIWERINKARLIVADLSGKNANVFYEVGLAHALSKEVILLTRSMEDVPFDLKALRIIEYAYTPRGVVEFETRLASQIQSSMNAS